MQVPVLNPQLRNAVLFIVQKDRLSIQKRSKNFVIKGLKTSTFGNDTVLASNIIYEHFGVCADIVNTRRLGQSGNSVVQTAISHVQKQQGRGSGSFARQGSTQRI